MPCLVPGLGLDDREWEAVRDRLGDGSVAALLPSLGGPARRRTDLRAEAQAERLLADPALVGAGDVVLVGHSASCPVVAEAALRSDRVVGLVLVGPVDPGAGSWPRMVADWLRTATHELPREAPVLVPQYLRTGLPSIVRGMDAVRRHPIDEVLGRLDLPVAVLRGRLDRIAGQGWCTHLAAVARGQLVTVDGGAHMICLTHPDDVAAAIRDVLDRSVGARARNGEGAAGERAEKPF